MKERWHVRGYSMSGKWENLFTYFFTYWLETFLPPNINQIYNPFYSKTNWLSLMLTPEPKYGKNFVLMSKTFVIQDYKRNL